LKKRAARRTNARSSGVPSLLALTFVPNCGQLWRYENITRIAPLLLLLAPLLVPSFLV